jgi:hypothetical protein
LSGHRRNAAAPLPLNRPGITPKRKSNHAPYPNCQHGQKDFTHDSPSPKLLQTVLYFGMQNDLCTPSALYDGGFVLSITSCPNRGALFIVRLKL